MWRSSPPPMGAMYTCARSVRSCFENATHLLSGDTENEPIRATVSDVTTVVFASATE